MTVLTLTYHDSLSYVTAAATSLPATADVALFERSIDQITWTQVRGGATVAVVGAAASINDYEFEPNIINYYRVSAIDTGVPTFVNAGTVAKANNASVSPAVPASYAEGDLLVTWATVRNSGTGAIVVPTNWTAMYQVDNWALLGKRAGALGSESAPTIAVTGGAAGADVIAQMAAWRNLELLPAAKANQKNPSAANITYPGLYAVQDDWACVLYLGWRQSSWTSVATLAGATAEIGDNPSALGTGAGMVWDYQLTTTPTATASGAFVVTGGSSAISYGIAVALRPADYITQTVASVTPYMNAVWLKYVTSPYLNRSVTLVDWADNQRSSRMGLFTLHGARDSVAFQDISSPRTVTMSLWTDTVAERQAIELILDVGGIVLVHVPPVCAFDGGYFSVGSYSYERPSHRSLRTLMKIPLTEVAVPDIDIAGTVSTWATLVTNYTSWTTEQSANATWSAVLALTGTPADVLVSLTA
jgi:hypothetical protein